MPMRAIIIASGLLLAAGVAVAQPPSPAGQPAPPPAAATPTAPAKAERGSPDEIICKRATDTGSRLKSRGKRICGTRREWEDHNSAINREFNNTLRAATPAPKG